MVFHLEHVSAALAQALPESGWLHINLDAAAVQRLHDLGQRTQARVSSTNGSIDLLSEAVQLELRWLIKQHQAAAAAAARPSCG